MTNGKVLVTGAPGWLGTQFVEKLVETNRDVRCLTLPGFDVSCLEKIGVEIVEGDITKPKTLINITNDVETVFHIAGLIHPKLFGVRDLFEINTEGTKNLLDISIKNGVKRFNYISSNSAVGCNELRNVLMNEFTPCNPYMNYGWSKFFAEKIVNTAYVQGKIETVILRPCWYYGPRQPERQTRLMKMIKNGKALLFGNGMNLRSMTYIDNLCDALMLAEKKDNAKGETYWIADEHPYSTFEIYQTIADLLDVPLKIKYIPGIFSDTARFGDAILQKVHIYQIETHIAGEMNKDISCSIEKAKKDLGYCPKIELREGMKRSIDWARTQGWI